MTLKLPRATDPAQARHNQILEANDVRNRKTGADLALTSERLTILSPNGTNFQIVVSDDGSVHAVPAVVSGSALPNMAAAAGSFVLTGIAILNGIRFPDPVSAGVTNVATSGLATGGPITSTGTVTVTAASKSDQQTGTSTTTVVTPAHAGDHDGDAKAWVEFSNGGSISILASFNVSGVVRNSAGDVTISFTTPFASANYAALTTVGAAVVLAGSAVKAQLAGSVEVISWTAPSSSASDHNLSVVCYGRQ